MIEDIKVEQTYGWAVSPEGEKVWSMVSYRILFKRDGEWQEVPVHHVNPFPPEKSNEDREGSA